MNKKSYIIKSLKIIFALMFMFLSLGDWHVHAASTHHCDEQHTAVHSDMKWSTNETCENSEKNESHEDYKQILPGSKVLAVIEGSSFISVTPQVIHQRQCPVCQVHGELNQRMLSTTHLLI